MSSNNQNKEIVIWDWDGPIVRTDHICLAIHREKNPNLSHRALQEMSDGNWWEKYEKSSLIPADNFLEVYREKLFQIEIGDDILETLEEVHRNYSMSIVSSNSSKIITDYLKSRKLSHYFPIVLGQEEHKSKVVKISSLLEKNNHEKHQAVLITDTSGDVKEAREVGIASIAITWGLHDHSYLEPAGPDYIVHKSHHIPHLIKTIFKQKPPA